MPSLDSPISPKGSCPASIETLPAGDCSALATKGAECPALSFDTRASSAALRVIAAKAIAADHNSLSWVLLNTLLISRHTVLLLKISKPVW